MNSTTKVVPSKRRPDFFVIGCQKAATTSLNDLMRYATHFDYCGNSLCRCKLLTILSPFSLHRGSWVQKLQKYLYLFIYPLVSTPGSTGLILIFATKVRRRSTSLALTMNGRWGLNITNDSFITVQVMFSQWIQILGSLRPVYLIAWIGRILLKSCSLRDFYWYYENLFHVNSHGMSTVFENVSDSWKEFTLQTWFSPWSVAKRLCQIMSGAPLIFPQ